MLAKAKLVEIRWDDRQQQAERVSDGKNVEVQFNPETLKLSFTNENRGGDQPGGNARQFVGSGSSKLSVELLFNTTEDSSDVRKKTEQIAYFIQAKRDPRQSNNRVPPGISFEWGSFIFRGVVDSMNETLDYFSEEGVPLQATISLSLSRQEIEFLFGTPARAGGGTPGSGAGTGTPGTAPLDSARPGDSVQRMAGRNGNSSNWKAIAAANDIDDPLRLPAGALLNTHVGTGARGSAGAGISASAGISAVISAGAGISAGGNVGFSAGLGGGAGFSASAGLSASAGISAGAGVSGGAGIGAGAGISGGAGIGAGAGISGGAGLSAGAGVSGGIGGIAGGGFGAGVDIPEE
jgi:hypothetical protein